MKSEHQLLILSSGIQYRMIFVDAECLSYWWPVCEPLISRGLSSSENENSTETILQRLKAGVNRLAILVHEDAHSKATDNEECHLKPIWSLVYRLDRFPNYSVAFILCIGGDSVLKLPEVWLAFKDYMKRSGASYIRAVCKRAQARLWRRIGFEAKSKIIHAEIETK